MREPFHLGVLYLRSAIAEEKTETMPAVAASPSSSLEKIIKLCILPNLKTVFPIRIHCVRIRIQYFRLNTDPDSGFWWPKNWKIIYSWIFFFFSDQKLQFTVLIPRPPQLLSKLQESLQPSKENIQHMKFLNFSPFLWVFFALPDPDLLDCRPDPIRIRIWNTARNWNPKCGQNSNICTKMNSSSRK